MPKLLILQDNTRIVIDHIVSYRLQDTTLVIATSAGTHEIDVAPILDKVDRLELEAAGGFLPRIDDFLYAPGSKVHARVDDLPTYYGIYDGTLTQLAKEGQNPEA